VDVVTAYPGTPSTEIGDTFARIAQKVGVYFEWSVNEKVALEVAIGAAMSGLRCMTFMKQVGLNVAADALMTYCYIGHRGAHVIVSADDPSCHSSQNEQDNRLFARFANLPMLEPSSPNEAKEMTRYALDISEELEQPVMLRTTTRICHTRGVLELNKIDIREEHRKTEFIKEKYRFTKIPALAWEAHTRVLDVMDQARRISEKCPFTTTEEINGIDESHTDAHDRSDASRDASASSKIQDGFFTDESADSGEKIGIITSGVSYGHLKEALESLKINARVMKIGMTNPLPDASIANFLKSCNKVIMVEEVEPYLEEQVKIIAKDNDLTIPILGKADGHFPRIFEYSIDIVRRGIISALGLEMETKSDNALNVGEMELPRRPPTLCPGCPHRASFYVSRKINKDHGIYSSDIGCYSLGLLPPLRAADVWVCMGASSGLACGFSESTDQPILAFVGDSTFFHSGLSGLINAVHHNHRFVYVILDNSTTAMTGHQPHPGIPRNSFDEIAPAVDIKKIVEALGITFIEEVNPLDLEKTEEVFRRAMDHQSVSVIIAKEPCTLLKLREMKARGQRVVPYNVDLNECKKCMKCINTLACPAFYIRNEDIRINPSMCSGCGVCAQICSFDAISQEGEAVL
jgi:indolepyruvate ferredoxin oxidoreductase alpha subunit